MAMAQDGSVLVHLFKRSETKGKTIKITTFSLLALQLTKLHPALLLYNYIQGRAPGGGGCL